jgi:hypothetical protein
MTGHGPGALSKAQRLALVTLALSLDELSLQRCCEVLPGNVFEPGTLREAIRLLEARSLGRGNPQPLEVMDAGTAIAADLAWLQ